MARPKPDQSLQEHINWYVGQGYLVQSQTETAAQLVKKKAFSFMWAFLWFLFFGIGLLIYIFYYMTKRDKLVYLTVVTGGYVSWKEGR